METFEWHKNPLFQNLFESEMGILQRGLMGDFNLVKLSIPSHSNERVIAYGELTYGENQKQQIQIKFPSKYPFAPPAIVVCNFNVDGNGNIDFMQPMLFGKGNQYSDGKMCLFEQKFWKKEEHNIGFVLRRAQRWLVSVHSSEGFRKDEIIEEYPSLMVHVGQVLIPNESFNPGNARFGLLELVQFKPNHYILEQNINGGPTFSLKVNKETFKWYAFENGQTVETIFPIFSPQALINVLNIHFGVNILEDDQVKNIALYFPSEGGKWHFFKIAKQQIGNQINVVNG